VWARPLGGCDVVARLARHPGSIRGCLEGEDEYPL
jgi:hypothetical protein